LEGKRENKAHTGPWLDGKKGAKKKNFIQKSYKGGATKAAKKENWGEAQSQYNLKTQEGSFDRPEIEKKKMWLSNGGSLK